MSLKEFIASVEKKGIKVTHHFNEPDILLSTLKELDEDVVEQEAFKHQVLKMIKAFIASKERGIYNDKDLKHCLLIGGPGIGKTMMGRILCKIFVGLGFIGLKKSCGKVSSFSKLQDELLRRQKLKIRSYEVKNKRVMQRVNATNKAAVIAKKCMSLMIATPHPAGAQVTSELAKIVDIIESTNVELEELMVDHSPVLGNLEVEADSNMAKTKGDPDLPFKTLKVNDVVSRYVGDTAHLCTKAMEGCMDGVAYFDEAYNLCNSSHGFSDTYGQSALTIINEYMSNYPDRLIVVFSGYKGSIEKNLFRVQEGLASRFTYKFEMQPYSAAGLTKIYIVALNKAKWNIEDTPQLRKIIGDNKDLFIFQGRDMYSLATYTKNIMSEKIYDDLIEGKKVSDTITDLNVVMEAIEDFKEVMRGNNENEDTRSAEERIFDILRS